jgi:molybdopterin synthase catalytic subunit
VKTTIADDFKKEHPIFKTNIAKTMDLSQWQQAVEESPVIATIGKINLKIAKD